MKAQGAQKAPPPTREELERAIENAIDALNQLDGDVDLEPDLDPTPTASAAPHTFG